MIGGPRRGAPELRLDRRLARGEPRRVEEAVLVEARDHALDLGRGHELAVTPHHRRLGIGHRVLAVEQRHELEERTGEQHDGRRVPGRIAQRDHPLALVLDGKRLHHPEPRKRVAHRPSRPR